MTDPYVILGVSRSATDEEVKAAYRELARKYHPDHYASTNDPTVTEVFDAKMKEINEAYDTIMTARRNGSDVFVGSSTSSNSSYSGNYGYSDTQSGGYGNQSQSRTKQDSSTTTSFADVRQMINKNKFSEAEELLDGVPMTRRNAEWYFLKGTVLYHRGWIEQAYEHFSQACQLEPNNAEFRAAYNVINNQRAGKRGGYAYDTDRAERGCNPISICCSLFCADSCCECCGGDVISCC